MRLDPPRLVLYALGGGALLLAAGPAFAAPHTYTVVIDKMKFGPVPTGLRQGDVIVWANHDFLRHSATSSSHAFDVDLPAGAVKKMILTKSGTFPFVCRYHPGMRGTLVVK
ncbi:MAG TPA: cupredoxin domain-containing protein [Sphingomicrobium sp.]|nr:cupredoxin domain-containing protein [Sphingomicrobium sp.]